MAQHNRNRKSVHDWLCLLSGEDYTIINDSVVNPKVRVQFGYIGVCVLLIFVVAFYSCWHFIYKLFNENLFIAFPIGIFWGLMITNIYLLLLYTITPSLLKGKERGPKGGITGELKDISLSVFVSSGFRVGFVILIAIIVAQPWLITLNSENVKEHLDKHIQLYRNDFIIQADGILIEKELKLYRETVNEFNLIKREQNDSIMMNTAGRAIFNKIKEDEDFLNQTALLKKKLLMAKNGIVTDSLNKLITKLVEKEILADNNYILEMKPIITQNEGITNILNNVNQELFNIIKNKNEQYKKLDIVLASSNFYIRKIQIINTKIPSSWLLTILVIGIFVSPILLKYRIRNSSNFYDIKEKIERKKVKQDYENFKNNYSEIFSQKYSLKVAFYESCIDPPFNLLKKSTYKFFPNQAVLLEKIYSDINDSETQKTLISDSNAE